TSNIVKSLLIVLLAGSGVMANAQSPAFSIAEADSAYMKGEYSKTIQLYSQEIEKQGPTAPLLFNLGCAYYKSGNEGEARLCLERAKRLDPSNSQINQNIQYIENRVEDANKAELKGKKGDVMPDNIGFFGRVGKKISVDTSSDTWASFAVMAFILLILAVAVYLFSRNVQIKKLGFFSGLILLGFAVIFIVFAEMAASHFLSKDEAVITAFKVTMTSDPHDANATIGAPLCRGTKLHILESQLNADGKIGWYKVELNHSNVGWVDASDITVI
ncbi:MAG: tetratricopeptide repeat protein, partial [Bacteroidales bacterium]|nr:tetratricopeptide repeat protein [Bacteroidales bacterium]